MADQHANWLALLKWSLSQTGDGTTTSEYTSMTEDNRHFLEKVMREITSEPERLRKIMEALIEKLGTTSPSRDEETQDLLDSLLDIVEQIDMAQVFVKFGGVTCLLQTAKEVEILAPETRGSALSIIGTLAQNNLVVQSALLGNNILEELIAFASEGGSVWAKAVYAISCSVRGYTEAENLFMERYATRVFSTLQNAELCSAATYRRCVYFAVALMSLRTEHIDVLLPYLSPNFEAFLSSEDLDLREGTLRLMACAAQTMEGKRVVGDQTPWLRDLCNRDSDFFGSDEQK